MLHFEKIKSSHFVRVSFVFVQNAKQNGVHSFACNGAGKPELQAIP